MLAKMEDYSEPRKERLEPENQDQSVEHFAAKIRALSKKFDEDLKDDMILG